MMNEITKMFEVIYDIAQRRGNVEEALLYKGGNFVKIEYEVDGVTYLVSITKEEKKDA